METPGREDEREPRGQRRPRRPGVDAAAEEERSDGTSLDDKEQIEKAVQEKNQEDGGWEAVGVLSGARDMVNT